ncbi:MAG: sugar ABC transporter permease [Anaerolineales bacterium]|nr:sugar ABC transporter permease [Anaerolineales bacterium]
MQQVDRSIERVGRKTPRTDWMQKLLSGSRGRRLREYLTGYAFILPSLLLIFTFGLFPVGFALYVSLHKWKIKHGPFVGLKNYASAIDSLAYVLFFGVAIGLAYLAIRTAREILNEVREHAERPWIHLLLGSLHAGSVVLFLRYVVILAPEILGIADKVKGLERSRELFIQLMGEALRAESVWPAFLQWIAIFALAWFITIFLWRSLASPRRNFYLTQTSLALTSAAGAVITAWFTWTEMQKAIVDAWETGSEVPIGIQVVSIAAGVILLGIAWKLWTSAVGHTSDRVFLFRGLSALFLIIGAWLLIGEVPAVIEAGDKDLWLGLQVTAYYSLGTVPLQLSISLVLAYLLFQKVRGKEFFRVVYFLPYVTPAVASAVVFNLIFGQRASSPINAIIKLFGGEHQKWLLEPNGIFTLLGRSLGIDLPTWAGGPSLALVVIIIYSIWTYVGYDTVIYLAGLGNISNEINESAAIDGANRWQIFRHITLPLLSPTTYFLSLIAVIGTFKAFNHIYVLRHPMALGTVDTFSVVIFDEFFTKTRFGHASAMAFVLFAIILALTYVNNKVQGSRVFYG